MGFIHIFSLTVLLLPIFAQRSIEPQLARDIRGCHDSSAGALNNCLVTVLTKLRPRLATGIPELDVPPLEPIRLPNFGFEQQAGQLNLTAKFSNVLVKGFSNFTVKSLDANLDNYVLTVSVHIPKLYVTGNYLLDGSVLLLPIKGNGPFRAILLDINAVVKSNIVLKKDVEERLGIANTQISFQLRKTRAKLDNLFNGDPFLGQTANHFIAENDQLILDEIRPAVSRDIALFVQSVMDAAFSNIPVDVVFHSRNV